ncbi:hypothetical protein VNO78_28862 [Psophocarpus tetragonolobus]|uniref:Uncharacterized protein n=1 Tax=Psophocarpus tetragonolobus TaxID=3891 RepID=A0AAN9WZK9_PSOTE
MSRTDLEVKVGANDRRNLYPMLLFPTSLANDIITGVVILHVISFSCWGFHNVSIFLLMKEGWEWRKTKFLLASWCDNSPLAIKIPPLFQVSFSKECAFSGDGFGGWGLGVGNWNCRSRVARRGQRLCGWSAAGPSPAVPPPSALFHRDEEQRSKREAEIAFRRSTAAFRTSPSSSRSARSSGSSSRTDRPDPVEAEIALTVAFRSEAERGGDQRSAQIASWRRSRFGRPLQRCSAASRTSQILSDLGASAPPAPPVPADLRRLRTVPPRASRPFQIPSEILASALLRALQRCSAESRTAQILSDLGVSAPLASPAPQRASRLAVIPSVLLRRIGE